MEKVNDYILSPAATVMVAGSSKGAQKKYYENGYWYKENSSGYEGIAEHLATLVLKCSNIEDFAIYERCTINGKKGCFSKNFLGENETYISLHRLHDMYVGGKIDDYVYRYQDVNERIKYVESFVKDITGLDIHEYFSKLFTFDALILNTDRHFNNIGIIVDAKNNAYRFAPVFDNGRSMLSEIDRFPFNVSIEENIDSVVGKPFSANLEYQAHLFGYGLEINYDKLYNLLEKEEKNRALDVLYVQLEKYKERLNIKEIKRDDRLEVRFEEAKRLAVESKGIARPQRNIESLENDIKL